MRHSMALVILGLLALSVSGQSFGGSYNNFR
jgi:hypothetical protein